ncbi:MAG: anthranilate synthase component I [Armatimonadota bacterium]|nr:anthranilate synthase component I [Armatimonadota bacterium]MCX7777413.1 anthranilate synthase component I [Armatimonadota bacterium]MDW8025082.1 anthranilate synthase component I [Armatimonadota bacterium]
MGVIRPTLSEFIELSSYGNLIPVYGEMLADLETPVSAFLKLRKGPYSFLLESVEGGEIIARYSFLGTKPLMCLSSKGDLVRIERGETVTERHLKSGEDPLHVLQSMMSEFKFASLPGLPRFCGGAVGYIAYDMVRFFEHLPELAEDDLQLPDCYFMLADTVIIFDHVMRKMRVLVNAYVEGDPKAAYESAIIRIEETLKVLSGGQLNLPKSLTQPKTSHLNITSNMSRDYFLDIVRRAKEYIAAGDCIQVVLSQRLQTKVSVDSFNIYRALRSINPSPYMFYLTFGDLHLIGSSPEILVTCIDGHVRTRPLAGTRRRGKTPEEDKRLETELLRDEKERAEHIMLVDLGRNDIGRVCKTGSVKVTELMQVERYSHVMHIYSTVEGELDERYTPYDLLRASFPAGTVSGAPKVRAMEIIEELEPTRRGPYAGAVGYFSFSGNMDTAITIRTIVMKGNDAYVQAGAGIVSDSIPQREYEETLNKAMALIAAIEMAHNEL